MLKNYCISVPYYRAGKLGVVNHSNNLKKYFCQYLIFCNTLILIFHIGKNTLGSAKRFKCNVNNGLDCCVG